MQCPCGSGAPIDQCCRPRLTGESLPETAEALMRARYTAHVLVDVDFLVATHDPQTRDAIDGEGTRRFAAETEWRGLSVLETEAGGPHDARGVVEFVARYEGGFHHERSSFRRVDGRWYYCEGRPGRPPGRNEPCLCGSGKKSKRCCG